jgi:hypothetical protein
MLCERESAKVFWKTSFQPPEIPLKDKKWVSSVVFKEGTFGAKIQIQIFM